MGSIPIRSTSELINKCDTELGLRLERYLQRLVNKIAVCVVGNLLPIS